MTEFWRSGTGNLASGAPEAAFLQDFSTIQKDFSTIPNNTTCVAKIVSFKLIEKDNQYTGVLDKFYNITWRIETGEFRDREVSQKIKCFTGKPEQIDRNLNMLRLVLGLCNFKLTHSNAPNDDELKLTINSIAGIKIREWSLPKADGSGMMDGNFVAEVWPHAGFQTETGVKLESKEPAHSSMDSALSRNSQSGQTSGPGVKDEYAFDVDVPF